MKSLTTRLLVFNFALTIFISALLLFEVQPIISKFILPWFGGSPAVWTTCMVFFQTMLFAGYAYAHFSERFLSPRWQVLVHVAILTAGVAMLPIIPDLSWRIDADSAPTWRILCLLAVSVGLPYFAVSATGPLVQAWFCRTLEGRSPYRLYALSNLGSLLALLAYPFYIEPRWSVREQAALWSIGFILFGALCGVAAWFASRRPRITSSANKSGEQAQAVPTWQRRFAWLGLPALASLVLLATTNHVCQDVAVMPFLWVAPLSLYLLSFIVCFDHPAWYLRKQFAGATLLAVGLVLVVEQMISGGAGIAFSFWQELTLHFLVLFCLCMLCHGELVRLRPDPRYLTEFYLMVSAGGALGGMFVSLAAPHMFATFAEWRLGLIAGGLLSAWVLFDGQQESFIRRRFAWIAGSLLVAFVGLSCVPQFQPAAGRELFKTARNFYGVISVLERNALDPATHSFNFYSGRIVHGVQFAAPEKRRQPTAYFGHSAGIGQAFAAAAERPRLRVGVVGLGIGTLAVYAREGDYFRFYELNQDVLDFANEYFTYLKGCRGSHDVVLGDGRLSLESETPQDFDLLVLDAFSGDAVPTHLLTVEAFEIYRRHLNSDAHIAVNISNRYLDLSGVVTALAQRFGFNVRRVSSPGDPQAGLFPAEWMLLSPRSSAERQAAAVKNEETRPWTDDHSNLFEILK